MASQGNFWDIEEKNQVQIKTDKHLNSIENATFGDMEHSNIV